MTIPWKTVQSWLERNPFQTAALKPYIPASDSVEGDTATVNAQGWSRIPVSPSTPLSAILLLQDVIYAGSSINSRRSFLRDELTDLQEKALQLLKGRQWPVRKTAEGLVAAGLEEGRSWPSLGWRALCTLRECQLIVRNEATRHIQFFPEDVRTWSRDIPIFHIDHETRFCWTPPHDYVLSLWLSKLETDGWIIEWPTADGTVEQLKSSAVTLQLSLPTKCSKDSLCKRVGRADAIRTLVSFETP